jgi:hypothetical protein|tara:strand:+ start:326 stop:535 length:210 start_codon:yes stop_codon:yes gene_type:complete
MKTKKQQLQVTANNKSVMMWVISIVQNDDRQAYGVYTDLGEAIKVQLELEQQGFETAFLETCLRFAKEV